MTSSFNIIGVMSGTSVDGLDLCYVSFTKDFLSNYKIICSETIDYPSNLKTNLINAINLDDTKLKELDFKLGEFIGFSIEDFLQNNKLSKPDLISSHGHTVYHQPKILKTLQIGSGKVINKVTGVKTVNNFREQDVKLGGEGAPLVPIGDKILFKNYKYCLNLGGFVNISIKNNDQIFAYDICALNTVLNFYSKKIGYEYDKNGSLSKQGAINSDMFNELNKLNFYSKKNPKSLGIEFVKEVLFPLINKYQINYSDVLATYIKHVAFQIKKNINDEEKVLLSGGGSFNKTLIQNLENYNINYTIPENTIINFKESLIFALLGYLKINNKTNCLKSVTGASRDHSSGDIFY